MTQAVLLRVTIMAWVMTVLCDASGAGLRGQKGTRTRSPYPAVLPGGLPQPPEGYVEAAAEAYEQSGLVSNSVLSNIRQDNGLRDAMYQELPEYERYQERIRNPVFRARLENGLRNPEFADLERRVGSPGYQESLQEGLYRNGREFQQIIERVQDPSYADELEAELYLLLNRMGHQDYEQLSAEATAVEATTGSQVP